MSSSKYFKTSGCMSACLHVSSHEEEQAAPPASSRALDNVSLDKLFEKLPKMSDTLWSVSTDVSTFKQTTAELNTTVTAMQVQQGEAETVLHT